MAAYTEPLDQIRALIPDMKAEKVLTDEQVETFYSIEGSVKGATALALEVIASDQALTLKVIRLLQMQTDGAKLSDALLKRAALLRSQVADAAEVTSPGFEIAEQVYTPFSWVEYFDAEISRWPL